MTVEPEKTTEELLAEVAELRRQLESLRRADSKRQEAEEALRQSEERYRAIIEGMVDDYWELDLKGRFTFFNDHLMKSHGRSREELMGLSYRDYMDAETAQRVAEQYAHLYATGEPLRGLTHEQYRRDGTRICVESNVSLMRDAAGNPTGFRAVSRDITERRQAQEALRQSEERYRAIIEEMTDSFWETDLRGNIVFFNNQVMVEQRRTREELFDLSRNMRERERDANTQKIFDIFTQVYRTGEPIRGATWEATRGDDTKYIIESSISLIRDPQGTPTGFRLISRDITQRVEAQKELQQAKEAAEAASQAKSEFLANMSHEIRTPMNAIIGMTELALDTPLSDEQRDYLQTVKGAADALLTLINDILDFSKIEAGRLDLDALPFDLRAHLDDTVKTLALRARQKGLELTCEVLPEAPMALVGDPGRLRQILINLIGNAIKFTAQGKVAVRVAPAAGTSGDAAETLLHFTVTDTGIGIAADKHQSIFAAFSQADGSTTRCYGGTGLGLTISAKLLEVMGGRIWVESAPGVGSAFHFTLPMQLASAAQEAPLRATTPGLPTASAAAVGATAALAAVRRRRILLVEDHVVNQRLAVRLLEKDGHQVEVVANGREAVAAVAGGNYEVVLMDVQMPEMNGYEATAAIRQREARRGGHVAIIAMTAHAMKGDREKCLAAGMDGYVSKPIKPQELSWTIAEVTATIERQEAEKRASRQSGAAGNDSSANDASPLDMEEALAVVDGDEALLAELAGLFGQEADNLKAALEAALTAEAGEELATTAHTLKGLLSNFGARAAVITALRLEEAAQAGDWQAAAARYEELSIELARLLPALAALSQTTRAMAL